MKFKQITIILVCFFLLLSSIIIFSNLHFHILSNGLVIIHGHPFDKNHNNNASLPSNSHGSLEYLFYFLCVNIEIVVFLFIFLLFFYKLVNYFSNYLDPFLNLNPILLFPSHRAPPLK